MGVFPILKTGTRDIFPRGLWWCLHWSKFPKNSTVLWQTKRELSLSLLLSFIVQNKSQDVELKDARGWHEGWARLRGQGQWSHRKKWQLECWMRSHLESRNFKPLPLPLHWYSFWAYLPRTPGPHVWVRHTCLIFISIQQAATVSLM